MHPFGHALHDGGSPQPVVHGWGIPERQDAAWCLAVWAARGRWLLERVDESGIHLFSFADAAEAGRLLCDELLSERTTVS